MCTYIISMLLAAMIFENCTDDRRSGNILTSPELTLLSDQRLTFTMLPVLSGHHSSVNVYKTSISGRIGRLLGSFSATSSGWNISANITHNVCLPAGTYRLVFVASEPANVIQSTVALTEVSLTDSPCTYTSLAGNRLLTVASFYKVQYAHRTR